MPSSRRVSSASDAAVPLGIPIDADLWLGCLHRAARMSASGDPAGDVRRRALAIAAFICDVVIYPSRAYH